MKQETLTIDTSVKEGLLDITQEVEAVVERAEIENGVVSLYVLAATAAVLIQEKWEDTVQRDVIQLLQNLVPQGEWLHDKQEGNGDAHLKASLIGQSLTVPVTSGALALLSWQKIFLCEFDGPRSQRRIVCSVIGVD